MKKISIIITGSILVINLLLVKLQFTYPHFSNTNVVLAQSDGGINPPNPPGGGGGDGGGGIDGGGGGPPASCGDSVCNANEFCYNCSQDCGACVAPPTSCTSNYALYKSAYASGVWGDYIPNRVVDGNMYSNWNSGGGPTQWIEIDLQGNYSVNWLELSVMQLPDGITSHKVYFADSSKSYAYAGSIDGYTSLWQNITKGFSTYTNVQWVKIVTDVSPSWVAWNEIAVCYVTPTSIPVPTNTPAPTSTPTLTPTPTFYQIYGWVYTEKNTPADRSTAPSEGLISGYTVNLSGTQTGSAASQGSAISGLLANYVFTPLYNGTYSVALAVTPTGSVLYCGTTSCYTNPKTLGIAGGSVIADFPFVTTTPVPGPGTPTATPPLPTGLTPIPTNTPVPTLPNGTPTVQPTPTSVLPSPPASCQALPTPVLNIPAHQTCTNVKPVFGAKVSDPNGDNAWAHFYSNAYETWNRLGSPQIPPYSSDSQYSSDSYMLNSTGGYWWTAYTESSTCPRSADAPASLITMDYTAPPVPTAPNCTLQSQNLVSGACTFSCTWPADPEADFSCADTSGYHPIFWTFPDGQGWDPGWVGNTLSTNVVTASDGQLLYTQLAARDSIGNVSDLSVSGGPFTCPELIYSPSITPGGPTLTPTTTPTPTVTPSPTITPTPTPGDWVQVAGGCTYQKGYNYPVPINKDFITNLTGQNNSECLAWSPGGSGNFGYGNVSSSNQQAKGTFENTYNFSYYWDALKNKAKTVNNSVVGKLSDLDTSSASCENNIYSYSGLGYYTLDPGFNGDRTSGADVTIFLISGSLAISQNFSLADSRDTVVFIVNGNIFIDAGVTRIPGIYMSNQTFTVAAGTSNFILDGMIYANTLSLNRTYRSFSTPAYQFIYQPQYTVALLSCMGRAEVNWQEVKP